MTEEYKNALLHDVREETNLIDLKLHLFELNRSLNVEQVRKCLGRIEKLIERIPTLKEC